ncbi:MAG: PAS domain-containing protein [Pirellulaceae bacterium]
MKTDRHEKPEAKTRHDPASTDLLKEVETLRSQLAQERDLSGLLLQLGGSFDSLQALTRAATRWLRDWSGCEAVGIRLRDGEDFPYFDTRGFSAEFNQTESRLYACDLTGYPMRDLDGTAVLECTCSNVLCGRFNPALSCFTSNGSFWSNSISERRMRGADVDHQTRTCNRCNNAGYESVALIPLRSAEAGTLGLLQLNDSRQGRFSVEKIARLEEVATLLAEAMGGRKTAEELHKYDQELRESEQRFRDLAELLPQTIYEMNLEGRLTFVNRQALQMFGYTQAEFKAGVTCFQMLAACEQDRARHNLQRVLEGQDLGGIEYTAQRKDGSQFSVLIYGTPIFRGGVLDGLRGIVADISESKRAEQALRESESRLRLASQSAGMGIWEWHPETGDVHWSEHIPAVFGMPADYFKNGNVKAFDDLLHPEDRPWFWEAVQEAIDRRSHLEQEFRITLPNGEVRWLANLAHMHYDEADRPWKMIGTVTNISRRKQAEQALERLNAELEERVQQRTVLLTESEERYRRLFQENVDAILVMKVASNGSGSIVEANDEAVRLLGYSREELLDTSLLELETHETRPELLAAVEALRGGESVVFERIMVAKDDRKILLEIHCKPFHWRGELRVLTQACDITERKRAEAALRTEAELRRVIMQRATEGLCVCHEVPHYPYVQFTVWSERMVQITGYTMDEINRLGWYQSLYPDPESQTKAAARMARMRHDDDLIGEEWEITRADGAKRQLQISTSVIRDLDATRHVLALMHDITEQKSATAALRESEKRQAEMEKLAATARMAAKVAHEINNPLAGLQNSFHLIRDAVPYDHPDHDMVERIDREIDRIANIVRTMYMLYSPRAKTTANAVANILQDVLLMLEPLRRQYEVQFDAHRVAPGLTVRIPEGGLHQILYNLVTNAIEASPRGGHVVIAAELPDQTQETRFVLITVTDQGPGIPPAARGRIFEPFFTLKDDDSAKMGLGMGLSVVKGIVEAAGGKIDFTCAPGKETVFRVFLPQGNKV